MKRIILIILIYGALPLCIHAQFSIVSGTKSNRKDANGKPTNNYHKMSGFDSSPYGQFHLDDGKGYTRDMNFRLLPPTDYSPLDATKKYPMIIFLHGAGEAGIKRTGFFNYATTDPKYLNNDHSLMHGGKLHLDAVKKSEPDIRAFNGFVLIPQNEASWYDGEINKAIKIIELVIEKYQIDPNRIYVEGLSDGASAAWKIVNKRPDLFAAFSVFSGISGSIDYNKIANIPVWMFQGGADKRPYASSARGVINKLNAAGGAPRYTEYPALGHPTWNKAWSEPDFFYFLKTKSKLDIHVFFGDTSVCPGTAVNVKLGVSPGFAEYQWKKDGVVVANSNKHQIVATSIGKYQVRFRRGSVWTDWSKPRQIIWDVLSPTPTIAQTGTIALPGLDGSTSVTLSSPADFESYRWYSTNGTTLVSTAKSLKISQQGDYRLSVTTPKGCPSNMSLPVSITTNNPNGNGSPAPKAGSPGPPVNLSITPLSTTKLKLNWQDNSSNELGFEIYRSEQSGSGFMLAGISPSNSNSFDDVGLNPNTNYYYRIRTYNGFGGSLYTTQITGKTLIDNISPSIPQNLKVVQASETSISLSWSPSTDNSGIKHYLVYHDKMVGGPIVANETNFTFNGLTHETVYSFTVKAVDKADNTSPNSNSTSGLAVMTGLDYKLYVGGLWSTTSDFASWPVSKTGRINNFNINATNGNPPGVRNPVDEAYFAYDFSGKIYIEADGTYTFFTSSDDGSMLYINDLEVVKNDGLHGMQERSGSVYLSKGAHGIRVKYFNRAGGNGLQVRYQGPGIAKQIIPDNVLKSSPKTLSSSSDIARFEEDGDLNFAPEGLKFEVYPNFPNPFKSSTTISFINPKNGIVKFIIYNSFGEKIDIMEQEFSSGENSYQWDSAKLGLSLKPGIYYYSIQCGDSIKTERMVVEP